MIIKSARTWVKERLSDIFGRSSVFNHRVKTVCDIQDDALEFAAQIVENTITCDCKPEFCECYGWSTLEEIAEAIRIEFRDGRPVIGQKQRKFFKSEPEL